MRPFTQITILFFLISSTLFSQSNPPDLWTKAVDILSANLNWVPGKMTMQFEMLDKKGNADMITLSTYKIYADENGEVQNELVSMFNDGEDVTEKEKAKLAKDDAEKKDKDEDSEEHSAGFSMTDSPFHPDNQEKIQLKPVGRKKNIDGKMCRGFEYSLPLDEHTRMGTVWLDVETGAPVRHEYSTDPLPPKVKEMKNIVQYEYTPDGKFYATQSVFKGVGGFLFIKKSFRGTMRFADFWRHEDGDK